MITINDLQMNGPINVILYEEDQSSNIGVTEAAENTH